ncbi:MAG: glycosyltransferase family 2 protein [Ginsengibacter sp.]
MFTVDISIIIATRNREDILWETIEKACHVATNKNVEIIVINDGDSSINIPNQYLNSIIYFDNPKKGVSSSRNLGAANARGQILFFIDDDMWINSEIIDWIDEHLVQNKNTKAVYNINWEYPPSLEEELKNHKIGRYILSTRYNTMWGRMNVKGEQPKSGFYPFQAIASCSLLLTKEMFDIIGGYNEDITFQGEDLDLANRINQLKIPIYCVFDTTLYHNHLDRLHLDGFLKRIGNGYNSQFLAEHKGLIPKSLNKYQGSNSSLFNAVLSTEKIWIKLHRLIPENKFFDPFTNRLTGLLSVLEKYKQWKKVVIQSNT